MIVLSRIFRALSRHVRQVTWYAVFLAFVTHMLLMWGLLSLAGEAKITSWDAFPYYYMTTATTIGYGDLSPSTTTGRYLVAFLMMPGAVALFAAVLAKTSSSLLVYWKRHAMGKMSYTHLQGHTVLVGWRGPESARLVQLLLSDTATDDEGLVLVAEGIAENPLPEQMRFVAVESYADQAVYARAAVTSAGRVIVHAPSDDLTLSAVLAVKANQPTCHVVAHFDSDSAAKLVLAHHPDVECTRPMNAEIIARAAQDPGSSLLTLDLLSSADGGNTQFSIRLPADREHRAGELVVMFNGAGAIFLGYSQTQCGKPHINPPADTVVRGGAVLYYLRTARLEAVHVFGQAVAA